MRFVHVLLDYPVLSQTFVQDEVDALREAGHEVLVVAMEGGEGGDVRLPAWRALSPEVVRRVLSLLRHRPSALGALVRGPLTVGYRLRLLAAAEEARRWGADVVHAHFAYRSADGAEVIGRALGTGHSVTVHAHDVFVANPDLERRLRAARLVVTVCEYNRERLPDVGRPVHVVPCSTRVDDPPPREPTDRPVVLAVARLVPKKGLDVLVRAADLLAHDAEVVVVGDGPLRMDLQAAAGPRVRLTGALPREEVRRWLGRAAVFCVPFRVAPDGDRDSMPVVLKEAMAAGVPVVSTREVGVPECVDDGVTGLLVPPDDPVALAAALDELLADPERRAAMGEAGMAAAAERFDLREQVRRLAEVLAA